MKLTDPEQARTVTFLKRKTTLFRSAEKLSTQTGADVGVMLLLPGGKSYSYASIGTEEITDKFLKVKLEERQRDYGDEKSTVFEAFEDLLKELQTLDVKEKQRILMYKIMQPGSEIPLDEHRSEQLWKIKLQAAKLKKEASCGIKVELLKFDLNVSPELEEEKSFLNS